MDFGLLIKRLWLQQEWKISNTITLNFQKMSYKQSSRFTKIWARMNFLKGVLKVLHKMATRVSTS